MYTLMLVVWLHWWNVTPTTIYVQSFANANECADQMLSAQDYYRDAHTLQATCTSMQDGQVYYGRGIVNDR